MNSAVCEIEHALLGVVRIVPRPSARRFIARWKGLKVVMTVPLQVSRDEVMAVLDKMAPRLIARRPGLLYHIGQTINLDGLSVAIRQQRHAPEHVLVSLRGFEACIEVGDGIDLMSPQGTAIVSKALCRIAGKVAPALLLPRARELAATLGVAPSSWKMMQGYRTLGKCTARREIFLSHALVFLPMELRDYIVCHELAHLTVMSHSPRFHELCDRYCGGREKELTARLRRHPWPILR